MSVIPEDPDGSRLPGEPTHWFSSGVRGIGFASLLSDMGHEIPTALLPSLLTSTLGAPAAALGLIEGIADGMAGVAKLAGGPLADDPQRRRTVAVGGYVSTAILSSMVGAATAPWQVAVLRTGAWTARGLRSPSKSALLADSAPAESYGKAYGFERAMDNLGAVTGPLLAIALVGIFNVRIAILLSIIPGLLAAVAIIYAVRHLNLPTRREHTKLAFHYRAVLRGRLGRILIGIGAFELGNVAATLLILRATDLLDNTHSHAHAVQFALLLYALYNASATITSVPAGHLADRRGTLIVLVVGSAIFALSYALFATATAQPLLLTGAFISAGIGIAFVETAESAAVATYADPAIRGSAFGVLAAIQSFGNLAASAIAGILWTVSGPRAAFTYTGICMVIATIVLGISAYRDRQTV